MSKYIKGTVGGSNYDKIKEAVSATDKELENNNVEQDSGSNTARPSRKVEGTTRPARRKVYERFSASDIPQDVIDMFARDDYELRWVRYLVGGEEDLKNLYARERDGYEFVKASELPEHFLSGLKLYDGRARQGLVTSGDLCLVKVDKDLRNSRRAFFAKKTRDELQAADVFNITRKGFKDLGSKSSSSTGKEPTFQ